MVKKGYKHTEEAKRKISESLKGNTRCVGRAPWNKGTRGVCKSNSGSYSKGNEPWSKTHEYTVESREKMSKAKDGMYFGEENPNWKNGVCNEGQMLRRNPKYAVWRDAVFERDDWTCQSCKIRGGYLHAHHIMFFSSFPEGRLLVANGQTLCIECHRKLHKETH